MTTTAQAQRGMATIIDNRDGSRERIVAIGRTVQAANATAFMCANDECEDRNAREGWVRFVALSRRAHG